MKPGNLLFVMAMVICNVGTQMGKADAAVF